MKFIVTVDCTPEEARHFLGLPDVKPMQDALMQQIQDRITGALSVMEPAEIVKTWLPMGLQGVEQLQKFVWSQVTSAVGSAVSAVKEKDHKK